MEMEITNKMFKHWLGSDHTLEESIATLTDVANGIYPREHLKEDIMNVCEGEVGGRTIDCDKCGKEVKGDVYGISNVNIDNDWVDVAEFVSSFIHAECYNEYVSLNIARKESSNE